MSAGIADAANLAWKLAGVLHGWAAPAILDAYEAERQPITEQASRIISDIGYQVIMHRNELSPEIERLDAVGEAARVAVGKSPTRSIWSSNVAVASTSATSTIDRRSSPEKRLKPIDPALGAAIIMGVVLQSATFHIYGRLGGSLVARAPALARAAIAAVEAITR